MKKLFLLAVSALMMLGSCSQDELMNAPLLSEDGKDVIVASFEGQSGTRMTEDKGVLSWEASDTFVIIGDSKETFTISDAAAGTFSGTLPTNPKYAVYYPADANLSVSKVVLSITLEDDYSSASSLKIPMWGTYENGAIMFKHLGAALKVSYKDIPEGYTSLVVEASEAISGSFTATLTENEPVLVKGSSNTDGKTITVAIDENQNGTFYVPLPVGTYDLKVTAKGTGKDDIELKSWSALEIKRSKLYRTTATYVAVDATNPAGVTTAITSLEDNSIVDLTEVIEADDTSIGLPNVDATYNFIQTPTTSAEAPLKFAEAEGSDGSNVNINMPVDATGLYVEIDTPNSTIALEGGTYESLTATTAENTLIIGEGVTIKKLIINGGNVRIEGGTVETVTNESNKEIIFVAKTAEQLMAIPAFATEVELGDNITLSNFITIDKNIVLNLNDKTITGTAKHIFKVDGSSIVVFKNGTIKNTYNGDSRCVFTQGGNINLTLESVKLIATNNSSKYVQPLTIGGSGDDITVDIKDSEITSENCPSYGITTYNPVDMTITNSTVTGYAALNIKAANSSLGSNGSTFNIVGSTLKGNNKASLGESNAFGAIVIEDDGVEVTVDEQSTISVNSTNGNNQSVVLLNADDKVNVTLANGVKLQLEGEGTEYFGLAENGSLDNCFVMYPNTCKEALIGEGWSVEDTDNDLVKITGK